MDSSQEVPVIDLREVIERLWSGRWWIAASACIFGAAFFFVAYLTTPVYRASVVLIPAGSGVNGISGNVASALGSLGGLASMVGLDVGSGSDVEEALAVLRSRQFIESFISSRKLMPVLFSEQWDAAALRWKEGATEPTAGKAFLYFIGISSIERDTKSGIVKLNVEWRDRFEAADWANDMVSRLNAEMRARAINQTNAMVGYLEAELSTTSIVATRGAISNLIEAQIQQRMLANVTQEYAFRVVDKAVVPDADSPVWPRKVLMLAAGLLVGFAVGVLGVFIRGAFIAPR